MVLQAIYFLEVSDFSVLCWVKCLFYDLLSCLGEGLKLTFTRNGCYSANYFIRIIKTLH